MNPALRVLSTAFFFLATALAGAAPAASGLVWETSAQSVTARAGQESVSVVYPFRNDSDRPLHIESIDPGCTCTSATVAKNDYAAGESGELKVTFAIGQRVGRQDRTITIQTDDPATPRSTVKLTVEIPELATIRPRLLFWAIGEKPDTKTAEIVLTDPANSRLETPQPTEPGFSAKLVPTKIAGVFRLEVTPASTATAVHSAIHIGATLQGSSQTLAIFAAVR